MFNIALINSYFDGSDYNQSVKFYIDDHYYYYLDPTTGKLTDFYLKENYAILYDNTVSNLFSPPINNTFYELANTREFEKPYTPYFGPETGELIRLGFQFDTQYDVYTR